MYNLLVALLGLESLVILAAVFTYEAKIDKLNSDYDELDAEFNEVYAAYCNMSDLALQYKELAAKATDESELYKEAYDSEHNAIHYELDKNEELEAEIKRLRNVTLAGESKEMQYESSKYKESLWEAATPSNTIYGHTPYNQDWHRSQIDFE